MLIHHQQKVALGSAIDLTLVTSAGQSVVDEWFRHLWLMIFTFESRFSRFLPGSELSEFNRAAGLKTYISREFHDLLDASVRMSAFTDGIFNPFVLPALQSAGYVKSMVAAHSQDEVDDFSDRATVAMDRMSLTDKWASIPYGTAIDLGGIGKGYLADKLADFADTVQGLEGYWISLGGDIVASGLNQDGEPWQVQIEDTSAPEFKVGGSAAPHERGRHAVATSSVLRRTGVKQGKKWHHLIDPRTKRPSDSDTLTASVHTDTALTADILASCAIILGSEEAVPFCESRGVRGMLLQLKDESKLFRGDIAKVAA